MAIYLVGCGDYEYVRFQVAQPEGVKESRAFQRKVKGDYINCFDPYDRLVISENMILNARTFKFKGHRSDLELDSGIVVNTNIDQELRVLFESEGYEVEIVDDTIHASLVSIDTIFIVSDNQVLKKFKGSYFLNFQEGDDFWKVKRLNLRRDSLLIGQISPSDTLLHFDFVTKTVEIDNNDSTKATEYTINASKTEFKKLMKSNSFDHCECYLKR